MYAMHHQNIPQMARPGKVASLRHRLLRRLFNFRRTIEQQFSANQRLPLAIAANDQHPNTKLAEVWGVADQLSTLTQLSGLANRR